MRPVTEYIRTLLFEHDYVTVPNFGAFIANYLPSSFNDISGSLMPPQKRIAFNEILKQDDGLLATYISRRESLTIDDAKRKIQSFVMDIKTSLASDKSFHFDRIGDFSLNEENNLVFDPDRRNNFFSESFGFDSIFPRKVERQNYTFSNTYHVEDEDIMLESGSYSSTGKHSKWTYVLYSLPVLLLSSGLCLVLFSNPKSGESPAKSSFNPLDYIPRREEVIKNEPKTQKNDVAEYEIIRPNFENKDINTVNKKEPVIVEPIKQSIETKKQVEEIKTVERSSIKQEEAPIVATIKNTGKRYLIVSGIFKSKENVEKLSAILLKNGFTPQVVQFGKLMKVVAAEANSYEEALVLAERHQKLIGEKPAILKGE